MQRFLELGIHSHDDLVAAVVDDSVLGERRKGRGMEERNEEYD